MELPFLPPRDIAENAKLYDAVLNHPLIVKEMAERWNIKYFGPTFLPAYEFMGNKRIASVNDMKGVKMRISGLQATALQVFGAVPTMVTAPEGYEALQRGTIDSFGLPYAYTFGAYKLHEVSKYATEGMAMNGLLCFEGVSLTAWSKLPERLKAKLPEAQNLARAALLKAYKADDEKWIPIFKQKLEVVQFPAAGARQARRRRQRYLGGVGQGAGGGGPTWPRDTELCEGGSGQVQIGRPGTKLERIGDAGACCRGADGDADLCCTCDSG